MQDTVFETLKSRKTAPFLVEVQIKAEKDKITG